VLAVGGSMNKGDCSNCGRKIQKTTSDKCMYCGVDLEVNQSFTQEEKQQILEAKQKLDKKLKKTDKAGRVRNIGTPLSGGTGFGGGEC